MSLILKTCEMLASPMVLIQETFNRANSTTSMGTVEVGNAAWAPITSTWGINNLHGYSVSNVSGDKVTIPCASNPRFISCVINTDAIQTHVMGPILRWPNTTNNLLLIMTGGTVLLNSNVGGSNNTRISVTTAQGSGLPTTGAANFVVSSLVENNTVTLFINNQQIANPYVLTSGEISAFANDNHVGIRAGGTGTATSSWFTNFIATT